MIRTQLQNLFVMARIVSLWLVFIAICGLVTGREVSNGRYTKIVGGTATEVSSVPYIAAVEFMGRFECPAVIIAPRWVASSAICMDLLYPEDIVVRTGATEYETGGHLWPVQKIVTHPALDASDGYSADLSLIQLALDIVESNTTRIIPIASQEPAPGTSATVSGWGSIADGSIMHRGLLSVDLPIYNRTECDHHYLFEVSELRLCTLKEGAGPCNEDHGDPLVVNGTLVGVKSWTNPEQCGNIDRPSIYANLVNPLFRDFIRTTAGV